MNTEISPNDEMHQNGGPLAVEHYFQVGASAMRCVDVSLQAAGIEKARIGRVLDMPCGHGRVLRHLRVAFPNAEITACDLSRDGVDFCAKTFGAQPLYSHEQVSEVSLQGSSFDLIWVGSLFTHLCAERWQEFLPMFRRSLCPTGILVFSAHGRRPYDLAKHKLFDYGIRESELASALAGFVANGFGYANYPGLHSYGISLSRPDWVFRQIASSNLRVVHFAEMAWDRHQDVYACLADSK